MGTDVFFYHSYAELYLRGKWVKATPAFDQTLCDRFRVKPLEFDGLEDSLMHPYNMRGRRHMEYLRDRGSQFDVPVTDIAEKFSIEYPGFTREAAVSAATRFRDEAEKARHPSKHDSAVSRV
jgi:hypothetical protein